MIQQSIMFILHFTLNMMNPIQRHQIIGCGIRDDRNWHCYQMRHYAQIVTRKLANINQLCLIRYEIVPSAVNEQIRKSNKKLKTQQKPNNLIHFLFCSPSLLLYFLSFISDKPWINTVWRWHAIYMLALWCYVIIELKEDVLYHEQVDFSWCNLGDKQVWLVTNRGHPNPSLPLLHITTLEK